MTANFARQLEIDRLCDEFEMLLRAGAAPPISEFLRKAEPPLHEELQHLLHEMQSDWERGRGGNPSDQSTHERSAELSQKQVPQQSTDVGRFQILRRHAAGGLGIVSVAVDQQIPREVALKEIRPEAAHLPQARARFLREAEITGALEHPGIVPIYGLGTYSDGRPYYAMRFIRGDSLKVALERFHADHPPTVSSFLGGEFRQLLNRFIGVCQAIQFAHDHGVLHRDLKPANIMLGEYGETLVVDWGLAKPLAERSDFSTAAVDSPVPLVPRTSLSGSTGSNTETGVALGTLQYMSPEQCSGCGESIGKPSDVYSLGATLYHVLTGQPPFAGRTSERILLDVRAGRIDPPRSRIGAIPPALEAICLKAMAHEPAARYLAPRQLAGDIEHWLADEPILARPDTVITGTGRFLRKHRGILGTGAAALVVLSLGSTAAGWMINNERLAQQALAQHNRELGQINQQRADDAMMLFRATNGMLEVVQDSAVDFFSPAEWGRQSVRLPSDFEQQLRNVQRASEGFSPLRSERWEVLLSVAKGLRLLGKYDDADAALANALPHPEDELGLKVLLERGRIAHLSGRTAAALVHLREAQTLATARSSPLINDIEFQLAWAVADHTMQTGEGDRQQGIEEAHTLFTRILDRSRERYGAQSLQAAWPRAALAMLLIVQPEQRLLGAVQLQQAMQIILVDPDRRQAFSDMTAAYTQGYLFRQAGQHQSALSFYRTAIDRARVALHPEHPIVALLMGDYAGLLRDSGDTAAAETMLRRALAIGENFAPMHVQLMTAQIEFASHLAAKQGDPQAQAESRQLLRQAEATALHRWGPDHPKTKAIQDRYSALHGSAEQSMK